MKIYKKAILPLGFKANGIACGLKKSGKLDLALICSEISAKAVCQFTTNKIQAAPIKINKRNLKNSRHFRAIIANSGNANCFTAYQGIKDAWETTRFLAKALGIKKEEVLVSSTGIIGRRLDLSKIKKAIPDLIKGLSRQGIDKAKKAIMTTDKITKEITVKFAINKEIITVCGVAKGAGMIAPNMATMLAFILTDANITQRALAQALKIVADNSFNCITVDGCMSTNDSVIMLANGAAKNSLIDSNKNFKPFLKVLNVVCLELAKMIIRDAEGATKFIQINVKQAKSFQEAKTVALSIANSNLFKTAMYGQNLNFGRIVAGVGASGVGVREEDLKINVSSLERRGITVDVLLKRGNCSARVYTSDLTPEYIKINAEYN